MRNLPLAVRLGGAFGALCVALAIVAFTGMNSMNGVRDDSVNLAERHLRVADLLGKVQQRAKDNVALGARHLYVHDGDLDTQDALVKDFERNVAASGADATKIEGLLGGHARRGRVRRVQQARRGAHGQAAARDRDLASGDRRQRRGARRVA